MQKFFTRMSAPYMSVCISTPKSKNLDLGFNMKDFSLPGALSCSTIVNLKTNAVLSCVVQEGLTGRLRGRYSECLERVQPQAL